MSFRHIEIWKLGILGVLVVDARTLGEVYNSQGLITEASTYTGYTAWFFGMTAVPYKQPTYEADGFNCPFCGAYSQQLWHHVYTDSVHKNKSGAQGTGVDDFALAYCGRCNDYSCWHGGKMVYPNVGAAPLPNPDLSNDIKVDYEEARLISSTSPRGAAALLRLAIQKLCTELGEKGDDLNTAIGNLVKKGLNSRIQQALDSVRVIGNEAVHPGQMDLRDDAQTVGKLFGLVNLIADGMISQVKRVDEIYQNLPEEKKEQIRKRNSKS